jgi:hypothetical protein
MHDNHVCHMFSLSQSVSVCLYMYVFLYEGHTESHVQRRIFGKSAKSNGWDGLVGGANYCHSFEWGIASVASSRDHKQVI